MNIDLSKDFAVLTGDIVGSSKLKSSERSLLPKLLKEVSDKCRQIFPSIIPFHIDIFRGDSWQFLVSSPEKSLRVGILIRALIKSNQFFYPLDTRISTAVGKITFISEERLSQSDGPAFQASGQGLESMPKNRHLYFSPPETFRIPKPDPVIRLIDVIVSGWTERQAMAVTGVMQGLKQEQIGKLWSKPISQQAVARILERSAWEAVNNSILYIEGFFSHFNHL